MTLLFNQIAKGGQLCISPNATVWTP